MSVQAEAGQLVFVCGALRSGTTLTRLMLDYHPEINNSGEFDFLFDKMTDQGDFPELDAYHQWLSSQRIFLSKQLKIETSLEYPTLIHSFITQLEQKNYTLALNVHRGFDRIPSLFPNTQFLHIIRDPRDVARSSIGMGWAANVYFGVDHWVESELSWQRLKTKIAAEQILEIRFEDLILNPESILQTICHFFGLSYSEKMLNYANHSNYSKPDPSLTRQWLKKLSHREIQHVEYKAGALMQTLGYELSDQPLITSIGWVEKTNLTLSNKLFKINFFIKKYGLILYCKERLSRHFSIESINKTARLHMAAIEKKSLK